MAGITDRVIDLNVEDVEIPPATPEFISQALRDLKSSNGIYRMGAAERLARIFHRCSGDLKKDFVTL
jgi:hypothetical protein